MKRLILTIGILIFLCLSCYARECGPGMAPCGPGNECMNVEDCRRTPVPPPPGLPLPIDKNIYLLLGAGFGLGIYFFRFLEKKEHASYDSGRGT